MIRYVTTKLMTLLAVRSNVTVGRKFHVGPGSVLWAPRKLMIGNNVYVGKNVTIQIDGQIGDHVLIGNNVGIIGRTDHDTTSKGIPLGHANWVGDDPQRLSRNTIIGSDVWVGFGAIILSGVRIGDSSVIAAGSVVTTDIPANSVAAGAPATVRKPRFNEADFRQHWYELKQAGLRRTHLEGVQE